SQPVWNSLKQSYLKLARNFLDLEVEYRRSFPQSKTIGREVTVKGYIDKNGNLLSKPVDSAFEFRGSIDRVDSDRQGRAVIYDYKSSASQVNQFGSWVKNNNLQLAIYTQALENHLTDIENQKVIGAFYFIPKTKTRDTGFKVVSESGTLFSS